MKITREDAFKILGVNEGSSADEIRSCYKKLALKWHPDKHGDSNVSKHDATLKFQEVSAAYKRLTTNMNDEDDEIDDNEFMNIREMMELFAHIFFHNGVRGCPHHGMDCCDYDDEEYFYSDDEYYDYTDEESEDEFLDSIAHRLRNKYEQRKYKQKDKTQSQRHNITEEEALRNARELIEEEELEKKKEEKKKAKRKKKKEKKKQKEKEKKEQEIDIDTKKIDEIPSKPNNNNNNGSKPPVTQKIADEKPSTQLPNALKQDNNTNGKKSKSNDSSSTKKNNKENNIQEPEKKDNNKNRSYKNTDGEPDEDMIDTNSAFFAHAASKAPTVTNEVNYKEVPVNNNKKKKGGTTQQQQQQQQQQQHLPPTQTNNNNNNNTTNNNHQQPNNNKKKNKPPPLSTTSSSSTSSTSYQKNIFSRDIHHTNNHHTSQISPKFNTTESQQQKPMTNGVHKPGDVILQSRQVAVQGNQLAQQNDYIGAVEMFTKAISLDPSDFRFFGNRSYCFDRLENYTKALTDSDSAIRLASEWPKGFFRKGRALTGLKRFQEAEQVFQQVLKLDPGCEDAQFELARVRVQILIDMGFTQSLSEQAVRTYGTVQQALEALLAGKVSDEEDGSDDVYFSDDDDDDVEDDDKMPPSPSYHTVQNNNKTKSSKPKAPTQPKCTALWVGNVDPGMVTEKQMGQLFSKCGKVSSVRILPHKYCAFVNYMDSKSAVLAMEKLQGAGLGNQKLLLRFPNNPPPGSIIPEPLTVNTKQTVQQQQQLPQAKTSPSLSESSNDSSKISGPVNGNECYFWRTTGCVFENQCRYRHVRGHKGVDLPKVQAKYGKLPASS